MSPSIAYIQSDLLRKPRVLHYISNKHSFCLLVFLNSCLCLSIKNSGLVPSRRYWGQHKSNQVKSEQLKRKGFLHLWEKINKFHYIIFNIEYKNCLYPTHCYLSLQKPQTVVLKHFNCSSPCTEVHILKLNTDTFKIFLSVISSEII